MIYSSRISFDGHHFIVNEAKEVYRRKKVKKSERDLYFDELYKIAHIKFSVLPGFLYRYIRLAMVDRFGEISDLDDYLGKRIENKERALYARKRRFWLKAQLNKFNFFYTQTFDSSKYDDEEAWREDLKKTMQNLHSRRGWHYIIKWERGGAGNRLHAHVLLYVPHKSQMPGIFTLKRDYSRRNRRMETRVENSFFADRFGRNDFSSINTQAGLSAVQYVGKYIDKTEDNITYSRGLATYLDTDVSDGDIVAPMLCYKKSDDDTISAFLRYVTSDFILYSPLFRWYREDDVPVYKLSG